MVNITRDRSGYGYSIVSNGKTSGDVRILEGAQRILSDEGGFRSSDQVHGYIERLKKAVFGGRIEPIKDRAFGASGFRVTDEAGQVLMEETGWQNAAEVQEFIADLKTALLEGVQVGLAAEKATIQFNQKPVAHQRLLLDLLILKSWLICVTEEF